MTTRTQAAYLAAAIVLVVGALSLIGPIFAGRLLGLEAVAPRGLAELRATFGALNVTMAVLAWWAIRSRPRGSGTLRALGLLWLGAAGGRLVATTVDAVFSPANLGLLVLQIAVGAALVWASLETPPSGSELRGRREAAAASRRLAAARKRAARSAAGRADAANDPARSSQVAHAPAPARGGDDRGRDDA